MATGEVVAVKVLASDSSQGEREFQTEVWQFFFIAGYFYNFFYASYTDLGGSDVF